jgi:hypothetical protein
MALGFGFLKSRRLRALGGVGRSLPLAWLVGLAIGSSIPWIATYNAKIDMCVAEEQTSAGASALTYLYPCFLLTCLSISMGSYVVTVCANCCRSSQPRTRAAILRRTFLYPLAFFITYAPIGAFYMFPHMPAQYFPVAMVMRNSNGLVNVLTYACVFYGWGRFSRNTNRTSTADELDEDPFGDASFHVSFGDSSFQTFVSRTREADFFAWQAWSIMPGSWGSSGGGTPVGVTPCTSRDISVHLDQAEIPACAWMSGASSKWAHPDGLDLESSVHRAQSNATCSFMFAGSDTQEFPSFLDDSPKCTEKDELYMGRATQLLKDHEQEHKAADLHASIVSTACSSQHSLQQ